jgi:hypothetical protein
MKVLIDLRATLPSTRDQGGRPTCLAFAVSDVHSYNIDSATHLSVEYLFYQSAQLMATPDHDAGITVREASQALSRFGQPIEEAWPYTDPVYLPWTPPLDLGIVWRAQLRYMAGSTKQIGEFLLSNKPVVVIIELTKLFYQAKKDSAIIPFQVENGFDLHALIVVGLAEHQGHRLYLVRNTWGPTWGDDGHAWLYERYLDRHLRCIAHI